MVGTVIVGLTVLQCMTFAIWWRKLLCVIVTVGFRLYTGAKTSCTPGFVRIALSFGVERGGKGER